MHTKTRCTFSSAFSYDRVFGLLRVPRIGSYLLPIIGPFATTVATRFDDSKINFIGNVSFEGNHAIFSGVHGKFDDAV